MQAIQKYLELYKHSSRWLVENRFAIHSLDNEIKLQRKRETNKIYIFTITAEIHARSLANFLCQYADRYLKLKFTDTTPQRARAGISTICYRKKQIDVNF